MDMKLFFLTQDEKKIRKHWLLSSIIWMIVFPILLLLLLLLWMLSCPEVIYLFIVFLVRMLCSIIIFSVLYFFAYRRYGNHILKIAIVASIIWMVLNILLFRLIYSPTLFFDFPLFFWWYRNSINLKRVNQKIKPLLSLRNATI